jgi:hypothetical protein
MKTKNSYTRWVVSFLEKESKVIQNTFDSTEGDSYNTYMNYLRYYGTNPAVIEEKLEGKYWKNN